MNPRAASALGAGYGLLGVALGAFGAHSLKERLGPAIETWHTGSHYQLIHAVVLAGLGFLVWQNPWFRRAALAFTGGILVFSGSLYAVALGLRGFGAVAPIGGLLLMAGWLCLGIAGFKRPPHG